MIQINTNIYETFIYETVQIDKLRNQMIFIQTVHCLALLPFLR